MISLLRFALPRLMAMLLLMQGVAAPAHCLERLAQATATPICTAGGGLRHGPAMQDPDGPAPHALDSCAICHAPPQGPVPPGITLAAPIATPLLASRPWMPGETLPAQAPRLPYTARAPPLA